MTRFSVVMMLAMLVFTGVAWSGENLVKHPVLGEVDKETARVFDEARARKRDAALAQYGKVKNPQTVVVAEALVPETVAPVTKKTTEERVANVERAFEASKSAPRKDGSVVQTRVTFSENQRLWGSFPEASIWAGAWLNTKHDTKGVWYDLKYMHWFTKFEKPENFGLGLGFRGDYGKNKAGYKWGYNAPGVRAGYYRGLGLRNSFETDAGLFYRFDRNRPDGFMPTIHAEFNRVLDSKNRLTFQVDGNYFPNDSWLGPGIYWEHKLSKDWKVTTGAGASLSWLDGDFISGFAPSVKVKYKNRYTVGLTSNLFSASGPFFGVILAYELTPDMNSWYESYKKETIKLIKEGKQEAPAGFDLNDPLGIEISEQPIDEMAK
ncbi:MAG: hypothetical protein ACD_8C00104G0002 [uncultured bacterium]|nr:MAG: hypothetical protein ACD_8C00104G0002 [uncultured bacterium]